MALPRGKREGNNMKILLKVMAIGADVPEADSALIGLDLERLKIITALVEGFEDQEEVPFLGQPSLVEYVDYTPVFFFDSEGTGIPPEENDFRGELVRMCMTDDSVYWTCSRKNSDDQYETESVSLYLLRKLIGCYDDSKTFRINNDSVLGSIEES